MDNIEALRIILTSIHPATAEEAEALLVAVDALRDCDGCKWKPEPFGKYEPLCGSCRRFYSDWYELG